MRVQGNRAGHPLDTQAKVDGSVSVQVLGGAKELVMALFVGQAQIAQSASDQGHKGFGAQVIGIELAVTGQPLAQLRSCRAAYGMGLRPG